MKVLMLFTAALLIAMMFKPGCDRVRVEKDCKIVCGDVGFDSDYAVSTGFFTYRCQCKPWPKKPVKVHPPS